MPVSGSTQLVKWLCTIATLVGVCGVGCLFIYRNVPPEPEIGNLPLSAWLAKYAEGEPGAETAIRRLGTNAIPCLMRLVRSQDSKGKRVLLKLIGGQSSVQLNSALTRQLLGWKGFEALGVVGDSAVPELATFLDNTNTSRIGAMALAGVGSDAALNRLSRALSSENEMIRRDVAIAFGYLRDFQPWILNKLSNSLDDPDAGVRYAVTVSIGRLNADPDSVVPALLRAIQDTNGGVRYAAVEGLAKIDPKSQRAVEALRNATKDPNAAVREQAQSFLRHKGTGQ